MATLYKAALAVLLALLLAAAATAQDAATAPPSGESSAQAQSGARAMPRRAQRAAAFWLALPGGSCPPQPSSTPPAPLPTHTFNRRRRRRRRLACRARDVLRRAGAHRARLRPQPRRGLVRHPRVRQLVRRRPPPPLLPHFLRHGASARGRRGSSSVACPLTTTTTLSPPPPHTLHHPPHTSITITTINSGYTNSDGSLPFPRAAYAAAADANADFAGSCGRCYEIRCRPGLVLS